MARPGPRDARRLDAARNRDALVAAAAARLARDRTLTMRAVAADAGVSRATLYRHFPNTDALIDAVHDRALTQIAEALDSATSADGPPLAVLRRALLALAQVGASYPLLTAADHHGIPAAARRMTGLLQRIAALADLEPPPPARLTETAATQLLVAALEGGARAPDPEAAGEDLFNAITEPLDQGLVLLDARGRLLALNGLAADALSVDGPVRRRKLTNPATPAVYEDGSACTSDAYPLARTVKSGQSQPAAVRGHGDPSARRWFVVTTHALRMASDARPYVIVGVFREITDERHAELAQLRPPGSLGRQRPVPLDVVRVLDDVPAHLLPEQLVAEARRLVGVPAALYVIDIDGSHLLRLAGPDEFPSRIEAPLALGPELADAGLPDIRGRLEQELPGVVMAPMWLRGRAVGALLAIGANERTLADLARLGAPAMELANGYTDVFDAARRRKEINPAAEIQQSLLAPRIARLGAGEVAAGMLPSYDVGGDWFDYVENRDGAWVAVADASGRGPRAAALGSIGLAALRGARRNDASLEEAMETIHDTICAAGEPEFYLTALVTRWSAPHAVFSWINAGHPPPILLHQDGAAEQLTADPHLPLGIGERKRSFRRSFRRLDPDDRVILHTDGISQRPTRRGLFGIDGIVEAAHRADDRSAPAIARSIQEAVANASDKPLRDDAAVIVLAPTIS